MAKQFSYGGQAVIEGVMMRGAHKVAVAVRNPKGEIVILEANPNPNLDRDDEFAQSADKAGLNYTHLIQRIVTLGLTAAH